MSSSPAVSTARSVALICAARIASVELNCSRKSASETSACLAISARPIRSSDFSASSSMNAAMMRSRAVFSVFEASVSDAMAELLH
jgi:hypothetical protein